jgi:hypothetical protein
MDTLKEGGGLVRSLSCKKTLLEKLSMRFIKLGWRAVFISENLSHLKDRMLVHETHEYFIRRYASKWFDNSNSTLESMLYDGGMTKKTSQHLAVVFKPVSNTCYSDDQLKDIIIDYLIGLYKPIAPANSLYFRKANTTNAWVEDDIFGLVYNMAPTKTRLVDMTVLKSVVRDLSAANDDHILFFHCTNWRGCLNICERGIDYNTGRKCLDFGILPSFYMSPNVTAAVEWGNKCRAFWDDEVVILVFKVSTAVLVDNEKSTHEYAVKIFEDATPEWTRLTTHSRLCKARRNELDKCDFVYGPMVANAKEIFTFGKESVPHNTCKYQLASKSDASDEYLQANMLGSIWLRKSHPRSK